MFWHGKGSVQIHRSRRLGGSGIFDRLEPLLSCLPRCYRPGSPRPVVSEGPNLSALQNSGLLSPGQLNKDRDKKPQSSARQGAWGCSRNFRCEIGLTPAGYFKLKIPLRSQHCDAVGKLRVCLYVSFILKGGQHTDRPSIRRLTFQMPSTARLGHVKANSQELISLPCV